MRIVALSAAALLALVCAATAHAQGWKPSKNVEIIVGVTPGGGIDRTARILQKILQDKKLIDVPVSVVNKPGGGMTIGMVYLNQHAGDAHYFFIAAASTLTNQIMGKSTLGHRDFTPIAMLYDEYIGFAVKADSPIKSGKELLDVLRNKPESLPIAIATSIGNTNHIAAAIAVKAAGGDIRKLRVVTFNSGGEAMTAVMGGHAGVVLTPAANLVRHAQSGRLAVVGVAAPQRLVGPLAGVPTWREQGVNVVVTNWRPILGPKGLSGAQIAYWEEAFAKVTRTDEWKTDVENVGGVNHYMGSRELSAYLDAQYAEFRGILGDLGLAK
jgi:putative tricarboxylic transport membrane protein